MTDREIVNYIVENGTCKGNFDIRCREGACPFFTGPCNNLLETAKQWLKDNPEGMKNLTANHMRTIMKEKKDAKEIKDEKIRQEKILSEQRYIRNKLEEISMSKDIQYYYMYPPADLAYPENETIEYFESLGFDVTIEPWKATMRKPTVYLTSLVKISWGEKENES